MIPRADRLFITWFTNIVDGDDHAVTDDEAGHAFRTGTDPAAVCGVRVLPVPLASPPGPRCPRCRVHVRAHTESPGLDLPTGTSRRGHRKRSRFLWFFPVKFTVTSASQLSAAGLVSEPVVTAVPLAPNSGKLAATCAGDQR